MVTLDQFRRAWYKAHVSHDPRYSRDRQSSKWRGTVLRATTWAHVIGRSDGNWKIAAINRCLPSQL
jgi:hypothetical protein